MYLIFLALFGLFGYFSKNWAIFFPNHLVTLLKSGLLHLTGQPYYKKGSSAKVKDGIRS
jgi:hypothetical protein